MKTKDFIRLLQIEDDDRGTEVRMLPTRHGDSIADVEIKYVKRVRSLAEPHLGEFVVVGDGFIKSIPPWMFDIQTLGCSAYWKRVASYTACDVLTRVSDSSGCIELDKAKLGRLCELVCACDAEIDKIFKQAAKAFEHLESPKFAVIAALEAKNCVRIEIIGCNDEATYDNLPRIKQTWNFWGKSDEEVYGETDTKQGE